MCPHGARAPHSALRTIHGHPGSRMLTASAGIDVVVCGQALLLFLLAGGAVVVYGHGLFLFVGRDLCCLWLGIVVVCGLGIVVCG